MTLADVDVRGPVVRVRGGELPDGASGLAADVSAAAAVDLGLEPGRTVYFAIKAQEVGLHPRTVCASVNNCATATPVIC